MSNTQGGSGRSPNGTESVHAVVGVFWDELLAHAARAKLESEGIEAWLVDDAILRMNPLLGPAIGGVKLQVNTDDEQAARRILERDDSEVADSEFESDQG